MSAQLGKGVRVYVGWTPHNKTMPGAEVCVTGVIVDGPFPPGRILEWPMSLLAGIDPEYWGAKVPDAAWLVKVDGTGVSQLAVERLLRPIDGGDPVDVKAEDEVPV